MRYGSGDHTYELVEGWTQPPHESFPHVSSICIDGNDDVIVFTRSERPVKVFDSSGERLSAWGQGEFPGRAHGMCLGPDGNLYCTDDIDHLVKKFTPDGERLMTLETEDGPSDTGYRHVSDLFERIASIERGAGPFNRPTDATVLDSGEIFVSDGYGNARVHMFSPDGDLLDSWGKPGPNPGEFRLPHSIDHDGDDRIWVADRENSRIQIFDADGEFITEWTDMIRPADLYVGDDTVVVSELCKRISVFTTDGDVLTRWGNEGHPEDDPLFVAPHTVDVDSNGSIYVGGGGPYSYDNASVDARTIQKFERVD